VSALKICPQCGTEYELDQRFCPKDGSTLKTQGGGTGDLVGSIIADRYHVLRKLGEGGMGTVYLAEHVKMGRKSAVKVMNPGMVHDADAISRFNREAANASRINHANVAAVYDFGETSDGVIYLAMEFIEGPTLTKVVHDSGALNPLRAADITRQAAEALTIAHDMGIVHRDLKPDNIMLTKNRDGSDCVKVVDFGIAKAANNEAQKVTKTGLVVGTPEYMSPEQLAGDVLDGRSDTYSLALVAFNMFTGKLPFPGASQQESMIMRLTTSPKLLSEMKPDVAWSPQVQAVMDRALDRDSAARYPTASDFARELVSAVQAMPVADATKAFTALMPPAISPAAHPSGSASERSPTAPRRSVPTPASSVASANSAPSAKTQLPPTRVSLATPPGAAPAVHPERKRSGLPVFAGLAVAVLVVVGVGAYMKSQNKAGNGAIPAQQGDTTRMNKVVEAAPPTVNLLRELDDITAMPDTTVEEAKAKLARLQPLDSVAQVADDSTFLRYRYMRGKAMIGAGDNKAGCDSLNSIQGKLERSSRLKNSSRSLLLFCAQ
jgi:eukaryotic-like serine/threonine-protein kinase